MGDEQVNGPMVEEEDMDEEEMRYEQVELPPLTQEEVDEREVNYVRGLLAELEDENTKDLGIVLMNIDQMIPDDDVKFVKHLQAVGEPILRKINHPDKVVRTYAINAYTSLLHHSNQHAIKNNPEINKSIYSIIIDLMPILANGIMYCLEDYMDDKDTIIRCIRILAILEDAKQFGPPLLKAEHLAKRWLDLSISSLRNFATTMDYKWEDWPALEGRKRKCEENLEESKEVKKQKEWRREEETDVKKLKVSKKPELMEVVEEEKENMEVGEASEEPIEEGSPLEESKCKEIDELKENMEVRKVGEASEEPIEEVQKDQHLPSSLDTRNSRFSPLEESECEETGENKENTAIPMVEKTLEELIEEIRRDINRKENSEVTKVDEASKEPIEKVQKDQHLPSPSDDQKSPAEEIASICKEIDELKENSAIPMVEKASEELIEEGSPLDERESRFSPLEEPKCDETGDLKENSAIPMVEKASEVLIEEASPFDERESPAEKIESKSDETGDLKENSAIPMVEKASEELIKEVPRSIHRPSPFDEQDSRFSPLEDVEDPKIEDLKSRCVSPKEDKKEEDIDMESEENDDWKNESSLIFDKTITMDDPEVETRKEMSIKEFIEDLRVKERAEKDRRENGVKKQGYITVDEIIEKFGSLERGLPIVIPKLTPNATIHISDKNIRDFRALYTREDPCVHFEWNFGVNSDELVQTLKDNVLWTFETCYHEFSNRFIFKCRPELNQYARTSNLWRIKTEFVVYLNDQQSQVETLKYTFDNSSEEALFRSLHIEPSDYPDGVKIRIRFRILEEVGHFTPLTPSIEEMTRENQMVEFRCMDGKPLKVSVNLYNHSSLFRDLFNRFHPVSNFIIHIDGFRKDVESMILLCNGFAGIQQSSFEILLSLAVRYEMRHVVAKCEEFLITSKMNEMRKLRLAEDFLLTKAQVACKNYDIFQLTKINGKSVKKHDPTRPWSTL